MYNYYANYLNNDPDVIKFIDWVSTNSVVINSCKNTQELKEILDRKSSILNIHTVNLLSGNVNISAAIEFNNETHTVLKLSKYNSEDSLYRTFDSDDPFLRNRLIKNSLYSEDFGILYHGDPEIVISMYEPGLSVQKALSVSSVERIEEINDKSISAISKFHKLPVRTHCTDLIQLLCMFKSALYRKPVYQEDDLIKLINSKIPEIVKFESKFEDKDFVYSHLNANPTKMILGNDQKVRLIDFEFAGVGLKYYDYANYYNFINEWHLKEFDLDVLWEMNHQFINCCESKIENFDYEDFNKCADYMKFVWGTWYFLSGICNEDETFLKFGLDWMNYPYRNIDDYIYWK